MRKRRVLVALAVALTTLAGSLLASAATDKKVGGYSYLDKEGKIDLPAYFKTEGLDTVLQEESIDFVMSGTQATISFQKELAADSFALSFSGVEGNTLKTVEIELTDVTNPEEKASLIFTAMSSTSSTVRVGNTNRSFIINGSLFAENNYDFYAHYDAEYRNFSDNMTYRIPVVESLDGSIFSGFSSHKVNLTVYLEGEKGGVFRMTELNRQRMGSLYTEDTETPGITVMGNLNKAVIGSTVTLPKAFATDVLADKATVTMTVENPDKEIVKATDGTKLEQVTPDKEYKIKIEKNGTYRVSYQATDGKNQTRAVTYPIMIRDNEAPKQKLSESIPTSVKVGDKLQFPEVICTDNVSKEDEISCWITVKNPSGVVTEAKREVELKEEGLYEITFLAIDAMGNMSRMKVSTYAEGE